MTGTVYSPRTCLISLSRSMATTNKRAMILIVLACLAFVFGLSLPKSVIYETEEDGNITIQADSPTKMDLSFLNMKCVLKNPVKMMFEMVRGDEKPKSQNKQFSGRVHCDKEALKQGQVLLRVTGLTAQDSGEYRCDMAANYDPDKQQWEFMSSVYFEINVVLKSGSSLTTTKHGAHNDGDELRGAPLTQNNFVDDPRKILDKIGVGFFIGVIVIFVACLCLIPKKQPWTNSGKGYVNFYP